MRRRDKEEKEVIDEEMEKGEGKGQAEMTLPKKLFRDTPLSISSKLINFLNYSVQQKKVIFLRGTY